MTESLILDVLLLVVLAAYVVYGFRNGLSSTVFSIAGVALGVVAVLFLVPLVSTWLPVPLLRLIVSVVLAVGLVTAGHALWERS